MPIPDFQTLMRPLLEHLRDEGDHTNQETASVLADRFHLSDHERSQLLPSGKQSLFTNRLAWAKSHLKQAGLIESPRWGTYRITPRGAALLREADGAITMKVLSRFPEYQEFRNRKSANASDVDKNPPSADEMTPEEHIEYGYKQIRQKLSIEILDRIKKCPPDFFERLVVDLIVAMGYGGSRFDAGRAVGRSGDGGIDGIVKEDRLGLDVIYIQAKRWEGAVGRPEVQKFAGALQGQRARKGIFITTSSFTREACDFASFIDTKMILIGGAELAELLIDHGVGVTKGDVYEIKRVDLDYFSVEE